MTSGEIQLKGSQVTVKLRLKDEVISDTIKLIQTSMVSGGVIHLCNDDGNDLIIDCKEIACVIFDRDGGAQ